MQTIKFIKLFFNCIDFKKIHYLILTLAFIVSGSLCTVSIPLTLKRLIDKVTIPGMTHTSILIPIVLFAFLLVLERFFNEAQFLVFPYWENSILRKAYKISYDSLFHNSPAYFKNKLYGSITSQIYRAISSLDMLMFDITLKTVPLIINFIFISTSMLFTLDSTITFVFILGAITYTLLIYFFTKKLTYHQLKIRQAYNHAQGITTDLIFSWKDIKLTNSYAYSKNLINQKINSLLNISKSFYYKRGILGFTQSLIICSIIAFTNYYEITRYLKGSTTLGNIVLINNYLLLLLRPLEALSLILRSFSQNISEFISLEELIYFKKEYTTTNTLHSAEIPIQSIHLINFRAGSIFNNINFTIRRGEKIAIIGPSGAGKSMLLNTLTGLQTDFVGEIYLNDDKNQKINPATLRNYIAYCAADARLITETISNNICLGQHKNTHDYINIACLNEKIKTFEQGLDTAISEKSPLLSTGEAQRIKIARTWALDRDFEFYDEATSALDEQTAELIVNAILSRTNKTIVFITHHTHLLKKFDKIYTVAHGTVSEINNQKQFKHKESSCITNDTLSQTMNS